MQNFARISTELLIKQQILQKLSSHQIGISSKILELTPMELRLSIFVKPQDKNNTGNDSTLNCRVCLQYSDGMSYIFEETNNEMTVVEKMCRCANVSMVFSNVHILQYYFFCRSLFNFHLQMVKDDGLPQYICSRCIQLLNSAYTFKTLCEKSDQELRITEQNEIKDEVNEYYGSVLDDTIENDLSSDNELKMNDNEIMISEDEFETNDHAMPEDNMIDHSSSASQDYLPDPFPEREYDVEVQTENNSTEIAEKPTDDKYNDFKI